MSLLAKDDGRLRSAGRLLAHEIENPLGHVDEIGERLTAALTDIRLYNEYTFKRLIEKIDSKIDDLSSRMDHRFNRLERKLDQFIDLHT